MVYLFLFTFAAGILLRFSVIGWLLILFGWLELILRGLYGYYGYRLAKSGRAKPLLYIGQVLYLAVSFFTYDFADTHGYCCVHLIKNPPEWLFYAWVVGASVLLVVIFFFWRLSRIEFTRQNLTS